MINQTPKTPDYVRRATSNYIKKFDVCMIRLPLGTKERIQLCENSINKYINELVLKDLDKRGL